MLLRDRGTHPTTQVAARGKALHSGTLPGPCPEVDEIASHVLQT